MSETERSNPDGPSVLTFAETNRLLDRAERAEEKVSSLESALAVARLECEAWQSLASYGGVKRGLRLVNSGDGSIYAVQLVNSLPAGKGATPGLAALDLARKLGLVAPAG